ncbi:hypothetical protein OV208_17210 [Corallococcus sp. bb12-1]|uniref:hypothetical protein n=1 Tax=Corallococcus sp. bb12-1 TaxID=2996784 RepID=UPI00227209EE|nr:hypothetical protein [Corallococcus sp. bb12-1]MCY1043063.1 hypothetical protein [Corallococcus sp. bb12-1]
MSPPKIGPRAPSTTRLPEPALPPRPRNEVKPEPRDRQGASLFESPKARKAPVALSTPGAGPQSGPQPTPGTYPTAADVANIASMTDPVARNLAITQGYHDLSDAMGTLLGKENANWSTYATWASKQAGVSIRQEDMPKAFVDILQGGGAVGEAMSRVDDLLRNLGLPALPTGDLLKAGADALNNVSKAIADGNQFVFQEVGHEFARFVETFQGDTQLDPAKLQKYLDGFPPDKALLKDAFGNYAQAMFEKDPNKKAELMLLANNTVGLHEQTQLQSYVEKALNSPVKDIFRGILDKSIEAGANALPFPANLAAKAAIKSGAVDLVLNPLVDKLADVFRGIATEHMMKLAVPGEALKLGNDLPPPAGMEDTLFPPHLRSIENPKLRELLGRMDSSPDSLKGTGAKDWSQLDQRMNYIVDLFRTRQSDPHLFDQPFGKEAHYPVAPSAPRPAALGVS